MEPGIPSLLITSSSDLGEAAEMAIRNFCGWHIAPVITQAVILDGNGDRRLLLPSKRVVNVQSVTVHGEAVGFTWSQDGWLTRKQGIWPAEDRAVHVVMEHGFATVNDLGPVVSAVKARAKMSPAGNVTNQRAGTQSVSFATTTGGAVASFPLLQQEKEMLEPYRLEWGW